jgi:hypothetical protein
LKGSELGRVEFSVEKRIVLGLLICWKGGGMGGLKKKTTTKKKSRGKKKGGKGGF